MPTMLSSQERRILAAARQAGNPGSLTAIAFDWRQAARAAGIRDDEAADILKGLRRFGYIDGINRTHALLTESGIRAAETPS